MEKITKNPVKYAVLTLKETDAKTNKTITRGRIVSKCYLLETKELHYPNGQVDTTYIVNFPYNDIKTYENTMFTNNPSIGEPTFDNEEMVTDVFDTYEEAKEELKITNELVRKTGLLRVRLSGTGWQERYAKAVKFLKITDAICSAYETRVLDATKDMKVEEKGKVKIK